MPHKRNPITCEKIAGLSRLLRGNALAAMENVALWHERDITHSSVERVIFPDSTILLDHMLVSMQSVIQNLVVNQENMLENLGKSRGMVFSQGLLLRLVQKGKTREEGYKMVQDAARKVWGNAHNQFEDIVLKDAAILEVLSKNEIKEVFRYEYHLKNVDKIFERCGIDKKSNQNKTQKV
jgi:adenylosuccinate lyase